MQLDFLFSHISTKKGKPTKHLVPATTGEREVMHFWSPTLERPRKKVALDSYHDSAYRSLLAPITVRKKKEGKLHF